MQKHNNSKNSKNKRKTNKAKCRDFLILNSRIYGVRSPAQKIKLKDYEMMTRARTPSKERQKYQTDHHGSSKQPSVEKQPRPPRQPKTFEQRLASLSVGKKRSLLREVEKELESTAATQYMQTLEDGLKDVYLSIEKRHEKCLCLLSEVRERISKTEYRDKEDIIHRIKDRKIRLLDNVRELFRSLLQKERNVEDGQVSVSRMLLSSDVIINSEEKIAEEQEIRQDRQKLIKHLQNKLHLKHSPKKQQVKSTRSPNSPRSPPKITVPFHPENEIDLTCEEERPKKQPVVIPMIMTRDRKEQMEKEKSQQLQKQTQATIQRRIALQLGYLEPENTDGIITNLSGIQKYLDGLIGYIQDNYLFDIIELINIPYGKSVVGRLAQMQGNSNKEDELNFILSDRLFIEVERKIVGTVKMVDPQYQNKEYEHIHNRSLFDCLNHCLNLYRPYYNANGDIFPWLTTEKGMTYYNINEDNIEEVFQKCKMKILETAANLCGLLPNTEPLDGTVKKIYEQKREEFSRRATNCQIIEGNDRWQSREVEESKLALELSIQTFDRLVAQFIQQW